MRTFIAFAAILCLVGANAYVNNWWSALDRNWGIARMPRNHALHGLWRNNRGCNKVYCIEQGYSYHVAGGLSGGRWVGWSTGSRPGIHCGHNQLVTELRRGGNDHLNRLIGLCRSIGRDYKFTRCTTANWWSSFDRKGWSYCPGRKLITSLNGNSSRRGCGEIYCLETATCCDVVVDHAKINRRRAAAARRRAQAAARRRAQAAARRRAQAAARRRAQAAARRRAQAAAARRRAAEAARRRAQAAARRRAAEAARRRRLAEAKRKAEAARRKRLAEAARKKRLAEAARKKRLAEAAAKRKYAKDNASQLLTQYALPSEDFKLSTKRGKDRGEYQNKTVLGRCAAQIKPSKGMVCLKHYQEKTKQWEDNHYVLVHADGKTSEDLPKSFVYKPKGVDCCMSEFENETSGFVVPLYEYENGANQQLFSTKRLKLKFVDTVGYLRKAGHQ